MIRLNLDADKRIIAAVDATERTLDVLELAKLLSQTTGAPVDLVGVFAYLPLADPADEELTRVREGARTILRELANTSGLEAADIEVIPGTRLHGSSSGLASKTTRRCSWSARRTAAQSAGCCRARSASVC